MAARLYKLLHGSSRWLTGLVVIAATTVASSTFATAQSSGRVVLYSDAQATDTTYIDAAPQIFRVYVFHEEETAGAGISFQLVVSPGFTGTWVGDELHVPFATGSSQEGIYLGYNACLASPILLITATYFGSGTSTQCSYLEAVGHPNDGAIIATPCSGFPAPVPGSRLRINCTVPVAESSWGRIKHLYGYGS